MRLDGQNARLPALPDCFPDGVEKFPDIENEFPVPEITGNYLITLHNAL